MDTTRHPREARDGTIGATAIMIAIVLATLAVAAPARLVRDMGTLGDLFSILALPIMLAVFYIAQRLYSGARRDRKLVLLEGDQRGRKHVMDTIDLCRALTRAVMQSGKSDRAIANMSMLRHIAADFGMAMERHGRIFSDDGKIYAEHIRESALDALTEGNACSYVTLSQIDDKLEVLKDMILDIDDPGLEDRRSRAASITDPVI